MMNTPSTKNAFSEPTADELLAVLGPQERARLRLRLLFERSGCRKYRMDSFESYDLYRENKNFLRDEGIITFTDARGRLTALKPDVTLSIIKDLKRGGGAEKLYYTENVFRFDPETRDYREIGQTGVELIGGDPEAAQREAVTLALRALAIYGREFTLEIGHMGLVTALLEGCGMPAARRGDCLAALRGKNAHRLADLCRAEGLPDGAAARLTALCEAGGGCDCPPDPALFADGGAAQAAARELERLAASLRGTPGSERLRFDFSAVHDTDYYNGVVLRGFLRGLPRAVLTGGRYDGLMRRFGDGRQAVGFALYENELERLWTRPGCETEDRV